MFTLMLPQNFSMPLLWIVLITTCSYSLSIECNATNLCNNAAIICDANSACSIKCHGDNICQQMAVSCPSGPFACKINCNGQQACQYATIDASNIIGGDLTISGRGLQAFADMTINCPSTGDCIFKAYGTHNKLFSNIMINAAHSHGNLLTRWSGGVQADWIFANATIYCPSGRCTIDCGIAYAGCAGIQVISQASTTELNISGIGVDIFRNSHIVCPPKVSTTKTCHVSSSSVIDYGYPFDSMIIDVAESFTNLDLNSEWNGSPSDFATIRCMKDYSSSCEIARISTSSWECLDPHSLCQNWISHAPTLEPTINPSNNPSLAPISSSTCGFISTACQSDIEWAVHDGKGSNPEWYPNFHGETGVELSEATLDDMIVYWVCSDFDPNGNCQNLQLPCHRSCHVQTGYPTAKPITRRPSLAPIITTSNKPSQVPSNVPSSTPTFGPLLSQEVISRTKVGWRNKSNGTNASQSKNALNNATLVITSFVAVVVLLCSLITTCCVGYFMYKKSKQSVVAKMNHEVQSHGTQSSVDSVQSVRSIQVKIQLNELHTATTATLTPPGALKETTSEGHEHQAENVSDHSEINDGHNEDVLNETLREVLKMPSIVPMDECEDNIDIEEKQEMIEDIEVIRMISNGSDLYGYNDEASMDRQQEYRTSKGCDEDKVIGDVMETREDSKIDKFDDGNV